MEHPGFFERRGPFALADVARATGAELMPGTDATIMIEDVRALSDAGPSHVSFIDNRKYLTQLDATAAGVSEIGNETRPLCSGCGADDVVTDRSIDSVLRRNGDAHLPHPHPPPQ